MARLTSIHTGKGDSGFSQMVAGDRVPKSHPIGELYNKTAYARNFCIKAYKYHESPSILEFIKKGSWSIGTYFYCLGSEGRMAFPETYRIYTLGEIREVKTRVFDDFVFELSDKYAELELATTAIRDLEHFVIGYDPGASEVMKYLNALSNLHFLLTMECCPNTHLIERDTSS